MAGHTLMELIDMGGVWVDRTGVCAVEYRAAHRRGVCVSCNVWVALAYEGCVWLATHPGRGVDMGGGG